MNSSSKPAWCVSSIVSVSVILSFSASLCHVKPAERGASTYLSRVYSKVPHTSTQQGAKGVVRIHKRSRCPPPLPQMPRAVHQTCVSYLGDPPAPYASLAHLLCLCVHPPGPGLLLTLERVSVSPGELAKTDSWAPAPRFLLCRLPWAPNWAFPSS